MGTERKHQQQSQGRRDQQQDRRPPVRDLQREQEQRWTPVGDYPAVRVAPTRELDLTKVSVQTLALGGKEVKAVCGLGLGVDFDVVSHVDIRAASVAAVEALLKERGTVVTFQGTIKALKEMNADTTQMDALVRQAEERICALESGLSDIIDNVATVSIEQNGYKRFRVVFSNTNWNVDTAPPRLAYDVLEIAWPEAFCTGEETMVMMPMSRNRDSKGVLSFFLGPKSKKITVVAVSGMDSHYGEQHFVLKDGGSEHVAYLHVVADGKLRCSQHDFALTGVSGELHDLEVARELQRKQEKEAVEGPSVGEGVMSDVLRAAGVPDMVNGTSAAPNPAPEGEPKAEADMAPVRGPKPDHKDHRHPGDDKAEGTRPNSARKPRRTKEHKPEPELVDEANEDGAEDKGDAPVESEVPVEVPIADAGSVGEGLLASALAGLQVPTAPVEGEAPVAPAAEADTEALTSQG